MKNITSTQPKKWRETIDPFEIKFKKLKIIEILGYPYAANDVFYLKALFENKEINCFLKYARHIEANIKNEIQNINLLNLNNIPEIIEFDDDYLYIVTKELSGNRLSTIVGDNKDLKSLSYMKAYGQMLALLHQIEGNFNNAPQRRFHELPKKEYFREIDLNTVYNWLIKNKPTHVNKCFIHGDFHYANVLWENHHISGILDFELSGIGNKEFDIAWAIILRPEQKFLKTVEECKEFIAGYRLINPCDINLVKYYQALIYSRFYKLGDNDYQEYILNWYQENLLNNKFRC